MAEDVKIEGTDKPIQSSELFTLESLQLIQIRDFDHSVQASHSFSNFDIACNDFKKCWWVKPSLSKLRNSSTLGIWLTGLK